MGDLSGGCRMNRFSRGAVVLVMGLAAVGMFLRIPQESRAAATSHVNSQSPAPESGSSTQSTATSQTQAIVSATSEFLTLLTPEQRSKVLFEFGPSKHATAAKFKGGLNGQMTFVGEQYGKAVWSNYPVSDVPRPGLALGTLTSVQRDAAMHLLQVLLSRSGYQKVLDIM